MHGLSLHLREIQVLEPEKCSKTWRSHYVQSPCSCTWQTTASLRSLLSLFPCTKKNPLYFLSQKNSSPYILDFWKGKKKPKWIFFEAETLTRYLGSSLKLHLLCLLKPSILIWRTGVPASPFLALSLSNTHGFPFHTFSPFFCHFHFTKLREGFGHSKKENKTKIAEKAEMPKWKNQIWEFCLMKQKTISFAAQLNFHFFLLMDIGGVLLLTWHKPPW